VVDDLWWLGMIAAVSLLVLFLLFLRVLGLIVLMGRRSSSEDVELLVLRHEVAVLRQIRYGVQL
jgi:hypothetical protein